MRNEIPPRSQAVYDWFNLKGWRPADFQLETWRRMIAGQSGLVHATTGAGKTLAVGLGAWQALAEAPNSNQLVLLWVTPMRALASDAARSLAAALDEVQSCFKSGGQAWTIGLRTGDTTSSQRTMQARRPPTLLVTTPESLSVMISREDARNYFSGLRCVVIDEWHELLGNKRGVQTQLALARLSAWRPDLMIWGMSATLGDLEAAKRALLGPKRYAEGALIEAKFDKQLIIDTLLPPAPERFPWAGHLGLKMAAQVVAEIDANANTLLFVNTRAQAELWYRELLRLRPDWAGIIAMHHGSLDKQTRDWVELSLKEGQLKAVVCTSSLDLGVDFLPVERVLQIGSPKGVARLLQRAGRSGHAPGLPSRVTLVPSHSLELVESAAAQSAIAKKRIESRASPVGPLDVLVQHLVTVALGGGFLPDELRDEIRNTAAYENLSDEHWRWCLDFVRQGGPSLTAYPEYRRVVPDTTGLWRVPDPKLGQRHRLNIGAIVSDASIVVQYGPAPPGAKLGTVEESFIARLKAGDRFWFGGHLLEFVMLRDLTAFVKKGKGAGATPRWNGGRMPLSTTLADEMLSILEAAAHDNYDSREMQAARPMLELQRRWSRLPTPGMLLAETLNSREGSHLVLYPFAGRNAHLGLASLFAWRAAKRTPGTFSIAVNDYGLELLSAAKRDWRADIASLLAVSSRQEIAAEIFASLNAGELARRRFRDIAQIAGLVISGYPGRRKSARHLQASSSLFYDVFLKYDPSNGLLRQAERELLEDELDVGRIHQALMRLENCRLEHAALTRCSPLAFPLMVERLREKLSNESLTERVERMLNTLNAAADE